MKYKIKVKYPVKGKGKKKKLAEALLDNLNIKGLIITNNGTTTTKEVV